MARCEPPAPGSDGRTRDAGVEPIGRTDSQQEEPGYDTPGHAVAGELIGNAIQVLRGFLAPYVGRPMPDRIAEYLPDVERMLCDALTRLRVQPVAPRPRFLAEECRQCGGQFYHRVGCSADELTNGIEHLADEVARSTDARVAAPRRPIAVDHGLVYCDDGTAWRATWDQRGDWVSWYQWGGAIPGSAAAITAENVADLERRLGVDLEDDSRSEGAS